jgi:ankyrin repeat protein
MLKTYIKNNVLDFLQLCFQYTFNTNHLHKNSGLLHYAIKHHNSESITILAEHNANLIATNEKKQTPLDYAVFLKCEDCANAIATAIVTKINQLIIYRRCESTNRYVDALIQQLKDHNLYELEDKTTFQPLFITDNPITIADGTSTI